MNHGTVVSLLSFSRARTTVLYAMSSSEIEFVWLNCFITYIRDGGREKQPSRHFAIPLRLPLFRISLPGNVVYRRILEGISHISSSSGISFQECFP